MCERIPVTPEILASLPRTTAWRAKKRGWYCPGYHQKKHYPGNMALFPVDDAYRVARICWKKNFWGWPHHKDDMIQAAILRMLELSSISTDGAYLMGVARNAMRDYVARETKPLTFQIIEEYDHV